MSLLEITKLGKLNIWMVNDEIH